MQRGTLGPARPEAVRFARGSTLQKTRRLWVRGAREGQGNACWCPACCKLLSCSSSARHSQTQEAFGPRVQLPQRPPLRRAAPWTLSRSAPCGGGAPDPRGGPPTPVEWPPPRAWCVAGCLRPCRPGVRGTALTLATEHVCLSAWPASRPEPQCGVLPRDPPRQCSTLGTALSTAAGRWRRPPVRRR